MADPILAGMGLVSPLGLGVQEHVFYLRASVSAPAPAAFERRNGDRLEVRHCGFLGATAPPAERLSRLAEIAAHQALAPWESAGGPRGIALAFVSPSRPGIDAAAVKRVRDHLTQRARASTAQVWSGAAGAFEALVQARIWLENKEIPAVLVVAADSHVSIDAVTDFFDRSDSPFARRTPPPAEGAAALLLTTPERARALGCSGCSLISSAAAKGQGHDDDDAILDGRALTALIASLSTSRIDLVSGQELVDDLRSRDWFLAHARTASKFHEGSTLVTLEEETGRLGAAAGIAAIAFGAGQLAHKAHPQIDASGTLLAWAISRDGTRGVALVRGGEAAEITATHGLPRAAALDERERIQTRTAPAGEEADEAPNDQAPTIPDIEALISGPLTAANDAGNDALPRAGPEQEAPVRLRKGGGPTVSLAVTYAEIVASCLDGIALAARHRRALRWDRRAREEERILAFTDALRITPRFLSWMDAWWEEARDLPDPFRVWAPVFVLGGLDGDDVIEGLRHVLRGVPEEEAETTRIAGEALAIAPSTGRLERLSALARDAHPCARAASMHALSCLGELRVEAILTGLVDTAPRAVQMAAARAAGRSFQGDPRVNERLFATVHTAGDPDLLWEVLRALALRGHGTGYHAMRHDPALLTRLASRALDVLAFFGDASDAAIAKTVVGRSGLTSRVLSGLGRYGHPGAAPLLIGALSDEDLADDAADALVWMFGEPFGEDDVGSPEAWRTWLRTTRFPEDTRLRFGEAYSPACVAEIARAGARSSMDLGFLVDEAHVRCGLVGPPDLSAWSFAADAAVAPLFSVFAREAALFSADPWRSVTRTRRAAR